MKKTLIRLAMGIATMLITIAPSIVQVNACATMLGETEIPKSLMEE